MHKNSNPPTSVTIIALFVLCITSWNVIRAYSVIANWQVLNEFEANPAYILATALLWALTGLWLFRTILIRYHYTKGQIFFPFRPNLAIAGLYYLWYWCDRLFIQPSPAPNVLFSAIVSSVLLALYIILSLLATKAFFYKE